jgi:hypothetical protein
MPVRNEHAFRGTILKDGGVLCNRVAIVGTRAKRGDGDGLIWRGRFDLLEGRVATGDTLHIRLDDKSLIALVVRHYRPDSALPGTRQDAMLVTRSSWKSFISRPAATAPDICRIQAVPMRAGRRPRSPGSR